MKSFNLSIYAADKLFFDGPCEAVNVPTPIGMYEVWADHRNSICAITEGQLKVTANGEEIYAVVSQGMIKVEDGEVLILVHSCERPEEIDEVRALRAKAEAERRLKQKMSHMEYEMAQATLSRAMNRLKNSRKKDKTV